SYPIKGTPYFDAVRGRVELPIEWEEASDRDYIIRGRRERDYYRLADAWLRSEVEAHRIGDSDPRRAAELYATARRAREEMSRTA
ncbi:MAG: B12-binding domain-containing radical SAM protein, partial [Steroidobacteraceae bacterium]